MVAHRHFAARVRFGADSFDTEADDPRFVVVALTPRSDAAGGDVAFVAFDTRLREAATREGLEVL